MVKLYTIIQERKYLSMFYVQFENFNYLMADPIIGHRADFRAVLMIIY